MALSLLDKISARSGGLTKSERKIAAVVLADPALTVNENIAQLARRAGVSEPTVYRFCKTFGTDGYPAFKLALSAELSSGRFAGRQTVSSGDSIEDVAAKVIGSAVSALNELERTLDCTVAARCVDLISQARRTVIAAEGLSQPAGMFFYSRMICLGLSCEIITDSTMIAMVSASLRHGELLIVISSTGQNRHMLQAVHNARLGEASVIALCPRDSELAGSDALTLFCSRAEANGSRMQCPRLALQAALEILISGVMLRRAETLRDLQERLNQARESCYLHDNTQAIPESASPTAPAAPVSALSPRSPGSPTSQVAPAAPAAVTQVPPADPAAAAPNDTAAAPGGTKTPQENPAGPDSQLTAFTWPY